MEREGDGKLVVRKKKPKGEDGYKVFSIRIREETVAEIEAICKRTGHSRNELIGILLQYALKHCEVEETER